MKTAAQQNKIVLFSFLFFPPRSLIKKYAPSYYLTYCYCRHDLYCCAMGVNISFVYISAVFLNIIVQLKKKNTFCIIQVLYSLNINGLTCVYNIIRHDMRYTKPNEFHIVYEEKISVNRYCFFLMNKYK